MKVLIADDDRVRVRMVSNYLERRGFEATAVPVLERAGW